MRTNESQEEAEPGSLVEGRDYYLENGLMVLTEFLLRERGYCCGNKCRHCPFDWINVPADQSRNSSSSL